MVMYFNITRKPKLADEIERRWSDDGDDGRMVGWSDGGPDDSEL